MIYDIIYSLPVLVEKLAFFNKLRKCLLYPLLFLIKSYEIQKYIAI